MASQNPGTVSLTPVKDIYAAGQRLRFDAPPGRYPNMLVFNLANTGEVQFLDMQAAGTNSSEFKLTDVEVVKPFGADHLITIWTAEPVDAIGAVLSDKNVTAAALLQALLTRLDGKEASVAINLSIRGKRSDAPLRRSAPTFALVVLHIGGRRPRAPHRHRHLCLAAGKDVPGRAEERRAADRETAEGEAGLFCRLDPHPARQGCAVPRSSPISTNG